MVRWMSTEACLAMLRSRRWAWRERTMLAWRLNSWKVPKKRFQVLSEISLWTRNKLRVMTWSRWASAMLRSSAMQSSLVQSSRNFLWSSDNGTTFVPIIFAPTGTGLAGLGVAELLDATVDLLSQCDVQ